MTQQLTLYDAQRIGAPHNGTDTSIAAAVAVADKAPTQKEHILALVADAGAYGMTQAEIEIATGYRRSAVCGRVRDLELGGKLRKTSGTRKSPFGVECAVYVLTSNAEATEREPPAVGHGFVTYAPPWWKPAWTRAD
jgi:hypothetical protein